MLWPGVYVASITPFNAKGEFDEAATRRHFDFLYQQGVHGLIPCGTTGESSTVSALERARLIEIAVEVSKKFSGKVIAGCGSNSTQQALQKVCEASELGADAALVVTPYYNKPTAEGVVAHYLYIADQSPLPLLLYNVPSRTGVSLSLESILKLFEHPKIVGMKEASGQYGFWASLAATGILQKKSLLAGDDDAFAAILALGGTGIISATANCAPKQFVEIFDAARAGDLKRAHELQVRLIPLVRAMFAETNPSPVKYALKQLGYLSSDTVRLPLVSVTAPTREKIDRAIQSL